jgi:hypothetical protein
VNDAEMSPARDEPEVDVVAMACRLIVDVLTDVPADAEEPRSWKCWTGPGHQPAFRADGTTYCGTCHPATVRRSDGR